MGERSRRLRWLELVPTRDTRWSNIFKHSYHYQVHRRFSRFFPVTSSIGNPFQVAKVCHAAVQAQSRLRVWRLGALEEQWRLSLQVLFKKNRIVVFFRNDNDCWISPSLECQDYELDFTPSAAWWEFNHALLLRPKWTRPLLISLFMIIWSRTTV